MKRVVNNQWSLMLDASLDGVRTREVALMEIRLIDEFKDERMKSRRDCRSLQVFQIELKDPAEAEAIISENLTCLQTGIILKVEEFRAPISVRQCYNCQDFGRSA